MRKGDWFNRYTVYNNLTDLPVIVDGTAQEAARAMGLKGADSFYCIVTRVRQGTNRKWTIIKTSRKELNEYVETQ